jgi:hypothetical protein
MLLDIAVSNGNSFLKIIIFPHELSLEFILELAVTINGGVGEFKYNIFDIL